MITNMSINDAFSLPGKKYVIIKDNQAVVLTGNDIPNEPTSRLLPIHVFRDRFTTTEMLAMRELEISGDAMAMLIMTQIFTVGGAQLNLDDKRVIDGISYWVSKGVLTNLRAIDILS